MSSNWNELLAGTTTSSACDALMKLGLKRFMAQRVRQIGTARVSGPALTIARRPVGTQGQGPALPNARLMQAIEEAPPGTVLIFNGHPAHEAALWGGLLAAASVARKLGGIVADGPVRDPGEIVELGCPCFCTGSVSAGQAGILELASVGEPLDCGDVLVNTGDFVFGDESGVVVIPAGKEHEILSMAVEMEGRDQAAMEMLKTGKSLSEVMRALGRA